MFYTDDAEYAFARGTFVKLQPQTKDFFDISNPKAMWVAGDRIILDENKE